MQKGFQEYLQQQRDEEDYYRENDLFTDQEMAAVQQTWDYSQYKLQQSSNLWKSTKTPPAKRYPIGYKNWCRNEKDLWKLNSKNN